MLGIVILLHHNSHSGDDVEIGDGEDLEIYSRISWQDITNKREIGSRRKKCDDYGVFV